MQLQYKILIIFFLAITSSCSILIRKPTVNQPIIDYRPVAGNIQPDIFIRRISNNQSELYLRIPKQLFISGIEEGESKSSFSMSIDLKIIKNPGETACDSMIYSLIPNSSELIKSHITRVIEIPAVKEMHWVRATLIDKNQNIARLYFIKVASIDYSPSCIPINPNTNFPLFQYSLKLNESFELACNENSPDSILVSYFSFYSVTSKPDSTWFQKPEKGLFGFFENEGIYRISNKKNIPSFDIRVFNNAYPTLNTPNDLWKPLVYIASKWEITNFDTTSYRKLAIDNFWLTRQSDPYKSRELIAGYYGRVFWANQIFTESMPGWKTDRGRTLILLGVPLDAISDGKTEKWFYRDQKGNRFSIEFIDNNSNSPIPDFRFSKRIPSEIEKLAIDGWNKGEPINFGLTN